MSIQLGRHNMKRGSWVIAHTRTFVPLLGLIERVDPVGVALRCVRLLDCKPPVRDQVEIPWSAIEAMQVMRAG